MVSHLCAELIGSEPGDRLSGNLGLVVDSLDGNKHLPESTSLNDVVLKLCCKLLALVHLIGLRTVRTATQSESTYMDMLCGWKHCKHEDKAERVVEVSNSVNESGITATAGELDACNWQRYRSLTMWCKCILGADS